MQNAKKYKSKILLFGEYTVLHGSKALAMPFAKYSGRWIYDADHPSRKEINKLKQYLITEHRKGALDGFNFDELERQISNGLAFDSNIPQGYGVGSSGSVTAAVYDLFYEHTESVSLDDLQANLGLIESCYHGESSGIDPLVTYLSQPILMHSKHKIELLDRVNESINTRLALIDTEIQRSTAPLVEAYQATRRESELFLLEMQAIAEINDKLIDAYLINDRVMFDSLFIELSHAQYKTMSMMIPDQYRSLWRTGLESGHYSMKINGAGGGGFLMILKHHDDYELEFDTIPIV